MYAVVSFRRNSVKSSGFWVYILVGSFKVETDSFFSHFMHAKIVFIFPASGIVCGKTRETKHKKFTLALQ